MLTTSVGGSTENDDTDVTVMPVMSLPRPTVITLTPPARWRMAPRKSTEETSRSILMLRTAEFMAASQVKCFVRGLEQVAQDRTFQRREIGRAAPARSRDVDIDIVRDAAVFNDQHTIGERDRFGNIDSDRVSTSSAPSRSSKARTRGWLTSARASATRCFWPPDRTAGH